MIFLISGNLLMNRTVLATATTVRNVVVLLGMCLRSATCVNTAGFTNSVTDIVDVDGVMPIQPNTNVFPAMGFLLTLTGLATLLSQQISFNALKSISLVRFFPAKQPPTHVFFRLSDSGRLGSCFNHCRNDCSSWNIVVCCDAHPIQRRL